MRPPRLATPLLALTLLTGCAAHTTTTAGPPADPATPVASTPAPSPVPVGVPLDSGDPTPPPSTAPEASPDAPTVAVAAVTAFAHPALPYDTWWAGLAPYLSPTARTAYAGTDPTLVPATAVTGTPVDVGSASAYLDTVQVPTDAGVYVVLCSRTEDGSWQVEQLTPTGGGR